MCLTNLFSKQHMIVFNFFPFVFFMQPFSLTRTRYLFIYLVVVFLFSIRSSHHQIETRCPDRHTDIQSWSPHWGASNRALFCMASVFVFLSSARSDQNKSTEKKERESFSRWRGWRCTIRLCVSILEIWKALAF